MASEFAVIAEKIEIDIKNGTYTDTLPSISALSQMFNVCPATVKRILSLLRDRELVNGEHGRCVRVNPKAAGNPFFHKNVVFLSDLFNISTPFYADTIDILTRKLFKNYISVHIFVSENQAHECNFKPDCVLVINNSGKIMLDILLQKFPECKVLKLNQHSHLYPYIMTDGKAAGNMAMKHLAEDCGHTHIGVLATQLQYPHACFSQRYKGAVEYAAKHPDIKLSMVEIPEFELHSQSSYELTEELMERDPQITAVFATCDILAFGVYNYAAKNNLRIPEDLAVLGFGNNNFSTCFVPSLSTLSENTKGVSDKLYYLIRNLLMDKKIEQQCFVEPYLLARESTLQKNNNL